MPRYTFEVHTVSTVAVDADTLEDARQAFESLDGVTPSGPFSTGIAHATMTVQTVSLDTDEHDDLDSLTPAAKDDEDLSDMDEPVECSNDECREMYDEARGDGYMGECPSCADKGEPEPMDMSGGSHGSTDR